MAEFTRGFANVANAEPGAPIRFVASTPGVKRDGIEINQQRWLLENYKRNPVFLWAHDYTGRTLPLGRASVWVDGNELVSDVVFDQGDEFARQVEGKYRRGYLNAVSVGWDNTREGEHELLDISAVPVPGDPDALILRQYNALQVILAESQPAPSDEDTAANRTVEADHERVGAMLNARNRADLRQAMTLIQGVMDRAEPAPDETQGKDKDKDEDEDSGWRAVDNNDTDSVTALWLYTQTIGGLRS